MVKLVAPTSRSHRSASRRRGLWRVLTIALSLVALVTIARAQRYLDVNGSTTGSGVTNNSTYNWSGSIWSSSAAGTGTPGTWTGSNAQFSAGTDALGVNFTVNVNGAYSLATLNVTEGDVTLAAGASSGNRLSLSGTATFTVAANQSLTFTGSNATAQFQGGTRTLTVNATGDATFGVAMSGSGAITKTGSGTLTFTGANANTSSGALRVFDGTLALAKTDGVAASASTAISIGDGTGAAGSAILRFDADNQLADTAALTLSADGLVNLNGHVETIGSIAGSGEIQIGAGSLISAGNASTTFSGQLTGNGTFTKQGSGTLTLSASTLNFGGTVELNAGTLLLSSTNASFDTLSITGNTTLDFGGTASTLNLNTLTIADGVTLTIANWAEGLDALYALSWTNGTFDTQGTTPMTQIVFGGFTANDTRWQAFDNQITPVPEPSTYGALLFATLLGGFGWRRWRAGLTRKL